MLETIDLKQIERKAYRATFEDGLMDIYLGAIIAVSGIFLYRAESGYSAINVIAYVLSLVVLHGLYMAGKKYITLPRMGQVRFGPARQHRKKTMAAVLGVIVVVQVFLVGLTSIAWLNPAMGENLFASVDSYSSENLLVAALSSLFVGIPMLVSAYMKDFPRGYYIAVMMALAIFLMLLTNQPVYPAVIGAIIILPGVVLLIRFMKKYPLPPEAEFHG